MPNQFIVVLTTAPSREVAQGIASALVEERLAACVNIVPGVSSVYRWEGRVESEEEVLMVVKAAAAAFSRLEARVRDLHPYDVPELVALAPEAMSAGYRQFLEENTEP